MIKAETENGAVIEIPLMIAGVYRVIRMLGNGGTSVVLLASDINTDEKYALKVISKNDMTSRGLLYKVQNEINAISTVHHRNIVKTYDIFEEGEDLLVFVMEYCPNGDLLDYATNYREEFLYQAKDILKDILSALMYLHEECNIAHLDLKVENILLDENFCPKITDFGFCQHTEDAGDEAKSGTLYYAAPELFSGDGARFNPMKCDIWSFGILTYAVMMLEFPFKQNPNINPNPNNTNANNIPEEQCNENNEVNEVVSNDRFIINQITNGNLQLTQSYEQEDMRKFVEKCTNMSPEKRPAARALFGDEFLNPEPAFIFNHNNNNNNNNNTTTAANINVNHLNNNNSPKVTEKKLFGAVSNIYEPKRTSSESVLYYN